MDKLSDRETALIEAARRELAARDSAKAPTGPALGQTLRPTPGPDSGSQSPIERPGPRPTVAEAPGPATAVQPPAIPAPRPDAAARMAALMQIEQEENVRRKKRLRQFGIVIPALVLIAATLWVVVAIFRYARM